MNPSRLRRDAGGWAIARTLTYEAVKAAGPIAETARALGIDRSRLSHLITDEADSFVVVRFFQLLLSGPPRLAQTLADATAEAAEARDLLSLSTAELTAEGERLIEEENFHDGEEDHGTMAYFRNLIPGSEFSRKHRTVSRFNGRIAAVRDVLWARDAIELRDALAAS